jgi:hypothetical protein
LRFAAPQSADSAYASRRPIRARRNKEGTVMLRLLLAAGLAVSIAAGCGGSPATPSPEPSAAEVTEAPVPGATENAGATEAPTVAPTEAPAAAGSTMSSVCAAAGVRKAPKTNAKLLVRLAKGTEVDVVAKVNGDAYKAGSCGTSGKKWLKIDAINGTPVQVTYGVPYAYAAAGFFK